MFVNAFCAKVESHLHNKRFKQIQFGLEKLTKVSRTIALINAQDIHANVKAQALTFV